VQFSVNDKGWYSISACTINFFHIFLNSRKIRPIIKAQGKPVNIKFEGCGIIHQVISTNIRFFVIKQAQSQPRALFARMAHCSAADVQR